MTITLNVRSNSNFGVGAESDIQTTLAANTAGNEVLVFVGWYDPGNVAAPTVAGGGSNTFSAMGSKVRNATQQYSILAFRSITGVVAAGSTVTYTVTYPTNVEFRSIKVMEISSSNGPWTFDPYDSGGYAQKTGTGNGTALSSTSGTPSQNNCAIFTHGAANDGTVTAGTGFTLYTTGAEGIGLGGLVQTTAAAKQGLLTTSISSQWGMSTVAIKDAVAASGDAGGMLVFF